MLSRRFNLRPGGSDAPDGAPLLLQASIALLAVLALALVAAYATEFLSMLAPTDAVAIVP